MDHLSAIAGIAFHGNCGFNDLHGLRDFTDLQPDIDTLARAYRHAELGSLEFLEAGGVRGDAVTAGAYFEELIVAEGIGERRLRGSGIEVGQPDVRVGDYAGARVACSAQHGGCFELSKGYGS